MGVAIYNLIFSDWGICLTGDNASTKLRVAKLDQAQNIGCTSHKLNLEVNWMFESHHGLKNAYEPVRKTISNAKSKLKNVAAIRNLIELCPILDNSTRQLVKYHILERFSRMRDDLIEASDDPVSDIAINSSANFSRKTRRYSMMLKEIDIVTKSSQTNNQTLTCCRDDLNLSIEAVEGQRRSPGSCFAGCRLGKK